MRPPLCEDCDHPIRRRRIELRQKAQHLAEKKVDVEMELEKLRGSHGMPERVEQLNRKHTALSARLAGVQHDLQELQEECDHPEMHYSRLRYDEGDYKDWHDGDPEDLPMVTVRVKCKVCGYGEESNHQP